MKKTNNFFSSSQDALTQAIEVTELSDGTAVVTISFEDKWCFAAEKALKSRFIEGKCKPSYVMGEVFQDDPLHEELHEKIKPVDDEGNPSAHYHIRLKNFQIAADFLNQLREYQQSGTYLRERNKIAFISKINPGALINQMNDPDLCVSADLVNPMELVNFMTNNNLNAGAVSQANVFRDCTDGFLSTPFYVAHIILKKAVEAIYSG